MAEITKMTVGDAYVLSNIIQNLLFVEEGVERKLPMNVKYKLQRNKDALTSDVSFFLKERHDLIIELGEQIDDEHTRVKEENMEEYEARFSKLIGIESEHSVLKLNPSDIDCFADVDASTEDIAVLMHFMVDDPMLEDDFKKIPEAVEGKTE